MRQSTCLRNAFDGKAHWVNSLKNSDVGVLKRYSVWNLALLCTVVNLPLHLSTRPWFSALHEEMEALVANYIETKFDEVGGVSNFRMKNEIRTEMEAVTAETDIAFSTKKGHRFAK